MGGANSMSHKKNKHLDFEVNLIPFIDLLSTCICFLLLTAVWLNVGVLNVKQAVGGQPASESEKKPTLWAQMAPTGEVAVEVRDSRLGAKDAKFTIPAKEGRPNLDDLASAMARVKLADPRLNTALIQPQAASVYEDIIALMDQFKKSGLVDLGVSPL